MAVEVAAALGMPIAIKPGRVAGLGHPHAAGHRHEAGEQADERVDEDQRGERGGVSERLQAQARG